MKRALSWLGAFIGIACLLFFVGAVREHWDAFREISLSAGVLAGAVAAMVLYSCTYLTGAKSWQLVLRATDVRMDYRNSLGIITVSQFAKYIPGNVGHHLGRVLLAKKSGISTPVAVYSIALDTGLVVVAAGLCSLGALELVPEIVARYGMPLVRNLAIGAGIVLLGALCALALRSARRHLASALRLGSALVAPRNRHGTALALLQNIGSFALGAAALGAIANTMAVVSPSAWCALIGTYAVAWLVGFLVPGAPAGLGVREVLLILGMTPLFGQEAAATSTALFRLVTVASDGLALLLGLALARNVRGSRL